MKALSVYDSGLGENSRPALTRKRLAEANRILQYPYKNPIGSARPNATMACLVCIGPSWELGPCSFRQGPFSEFSLHKMPYSTFQGTPADGQVYCILRNHVGLARNAGGRSASL